MVLALEAAQTAISTCAANGYKVAASIVDSAGVLKVLVAADGATKGAVESSTKKAVTANAMKAATSEIQEKIKTDQALAAKITADTNLFARAGGLPLMVGEDATRQEHVAVFALEAPAVEDQVWGGCRRG